MVKKKKNIRQSCPHFVIFHVISKETYYYVICLKKYVNIYNQFFSHKIIKTQKTKQTLVIRKIWVVCWQSRPPETRSWAKLSGGGWMVESTLKSPWIVHLLKNKGICLIQRWWLCKKNIHWCFVQQNHPTQNLALIGSGRLIRTAPPFSWPLLFRTKEHALGFHGEALFVAWGDGQAGRTKGSQRRPHFRGLWLILGASGTPSCRSAWRHHLQYVSLTLVSSRASNRCNRQRHSHQFHPISATDLGIFSLVKDVQPKKASSPIRTTESGIITPVKELQSKKQLGRNFCHWIWYLHPR